MSWIGRRTSRLCESVPNFEFHIITQGERLMVKWKIAVHLQSSVDCHIRPHLNTLEPLPSNTFPPFLAQWRDVIPVSCWEVQLVLSMPTSWLPAMLAARTARNGADWGLQSTLKGAKIQRNTIEIGYLKIYMQSYCCWEINCLVPNDST